MQGSLEMSAQDVVHKQCVYERCDCACVGENRLISVWGVTGMARGFDCRAELEEGGGRGGREGKWLGNAAES